MSGEDIERRLAAILCADVAGYSRLMEVDEEATIRALYACRQIVDELVANHRGRVFGSAGDSVIAEFASAVEAVRCAAEIQRTLETRSPTYPRTGVCACALASTWETSWLNTVTSSATA